MQTDLHKALLDLTRTRDAADFRGRCIGCRDCTGMCRALADTLTVPNLVLREERAQ